MTENELIAGCLRQDRACQEQLYKRFYGKMMGVCTRYARNRDEAADMLQEGFIKVFGSIRTYAGKGSFEGWIRRIIVHTAVDHLRRNKHDYMIVSTVHIRDESDLDEPEETDEETMLANLRREDILEAVQKLTPAYRAVFNLYVMEEFSHKEIAEQLGISEGTSKSNLAKARYALQKNLKNLIKLADGSTST